MQKSITKLVDEIAPARLQAIKMFFLKLRKNQDVLDWFALQIDGPLLKAEKDIKLAICAVDKKRIFLLENDLLSEDVLHVLKALVMPRANDKLKAGARLMIDKQPEKLEFETQPEARIGRLDIERKTLVERCAAKHSFALTV